MRRLSLAIVGVLASMGPAWGEGDGGQEQLEPVAAVCCGEEEGRDAKPASGKEGTPDPDPCFCIKEEVETYPVPGGYESRYLAERHDDGCGPNGCQAPATVYLTGSPGQDEEECSIEGQCSDKMELRKSFKGLEKPVEPHYVPKFKKDLGNIARIVHTDFLKFECPQRGSVRAKVFIVSLPKNQQIRPGQPARMIAIGYEVVKVPGTKPSYKVEERYVRQCARNECQYYVNLGGVDYAIMTKSVEVRSTPKDNN